MYYKKLFAFSNLYKSQVFIGGKFLKVSNVKREFHILSKSIKSVNYTARILIGKLDDFGRSQHNTLMVRILTVRKNIKIFFL